MLINKNRVLKKNSKTGYMVVNSWVWEVKLALQRLALTVGFVCLLSQGSSNANENSDVAQNS